MKTVEIKLYTINELSDKAKEKARNWWRKASECDDYWSECPIEEAVEQGQFLGIAFKQRDIKLVNGRTRQEPCILFSGFCSQGDGACFEGTWKACDVKVDEAAKDWGDSPETTKLKAIAKRFGELAKEWPEASFTVTHKDRYCHEYSVDFDFSLDPANNDECPNEALRLMNYMDDQGVSDSLDDCSEVYAERADYDNRYTETVESLKDVARDFMKWIYKALEREWNDANSDEHIDEVLEINEYSFLEDGERFEA